MNLPNSEKEVALKIKETQLNEWESRLTEREKSLNGRKNNLNNKETNLIIKRNAPKFALIASILLFILYITPKPEFKPEPEHRPEISSQDISNYIVHEERPAQSCVAKGIAYFKEIGSYPTLRSYPEAGRSADEVASERCSRSELAFGGN